MLKDRIREARKNAGLKQKEVAKTIGVSESTYCGYETGKREPDALKIAAIAAALGVSGDYLLGLDNLVPPYSHKEYDKQLVDLYWSLTPEGQGLLIDYAEMLLPRFGQKNYSDLV